MKEQLGARSSDCQGLVKMGARRQSCLGTIRSQREGGRGRRADARAELDSVTTGTSQPHSLAREMLLCVSAFREGPPLEPSTLSSALSFQVCTLVHSQRIQTIFPFHNSVCCSRPDPKGRKAAWPSATPTPNPEAGQSGHRSRGEESGDLGLCPSSARMSHFTSVSGFRSKW